MARTSTSKRAPKVAGKPVTFVVEASEATDVVLTGDFTNWALDQIRLVRGEDGKRRGSVTLAPGEYQYRLRIDGQWRDHPASPRRVPNPFGCQNCVLKVS